MTYKVAKNFGKLGSRSTMPPTSDDNSFSTDIYIRRKWN